MTDLRMGQVGQGPAQLLSMTTHYKPKNCGTTQRHNYEIYLETSKKTNVYADQGCTTFSLLPAALRLFY